MGKKKKMLLKYYSSGKSHDDDRDRKGKDKKKDNKKSSSNIPGLKIVHLSVGKKDAKEARKIVMTPVEVPKKFTHIRNDCNHAGSLITPAQFRALTPNYGVYTPMLDLVCGKYGEDNVRICEVCYDVLVNYKQVTGNDVMDAIATLYVGANKVVSMRRMKDDEIKDISKLKNELDDWGEIVDLIEKIDEAVSDQTDRPNGGSGTRLNDVGNMPVIT